MSDTLTHPTEATAPGREPLRREQLKAGPIEQFAVWFEQACERNLLEPNAMSLATAGADGRVAARLVLLKKFDARGFVFFTNLESKKSRHISQNSQVSLLFPWLALGRQVIDQQPESGLRLSYPHQGFLYFRYKILFARSLRR